MSVEEKHKLGLELQSLPPEKMEQAVTIIRKRNGYLRQDGNEIELDIEAVNTETLWELDRFVTNYKKVSSMKVIHNKQTGHSKGYGFVEFYSHEIAEKVLQNYNSTTMPNTDQAFHLNWASFAAERRSVATSDLSIFVGDLVADVTDAMLQETFASEYPSV